MTSCGRSAGHALVATGLAVAGLALPGAAFALSCASPNFTLSEAYEAADSIVVGLVTECKETTSQSVWVGGGSDCSFVTLEVLKEASPARDYGGTATSQACGLSLFVGEQYLLFLDSENRPLLYSSPLSGEGQLPKRAGGYLRILRDFRDDVSSELSEPWVAGELNGMCFLSHEIGGHHIMFSRWTDDAPAWPKHEWARETVDGRTVYRGRVQVEVPGPAPMSVEFVTTGDFSQYAPDMQLLQVNFQEWPPAPARNATLSVGSRVWPLHWVKSVPSRGDWRGDPTVRYQVFGDVTEEILSAMLRPSDVVVSASLVAATSPDTHPPAAAAAPDATVPAPSLTNERPAAGLAEHDALGTSGEAPAAVIRLETRSTQLAHAVGRYRACYGGPEP